VSPDPGGLLRERADHALIEPACSAIVNLFNASVRRAQLGILQASGECLVLPPVPLLIHQEPETLQEAQLPSRRILLLRFQCLGHSEKTHSRQFFDHGLFQHGRLLTRSTQRHGCCRAEAVAMTEAECSEELHRASSSEST
jgi:hypothetical protein